MRLVLVLAVLLGSASCLPIPPPQEPLCSDVHPQYLGGCRLLVRSITAPTPEG